MTLTNACPISDTESPPQYAPFEFVLIPPNPQSSGQTNLIVPSPDAEANGCPATAGPAFPAPEGQGLPNEYRFDPRVARGFSTCLVGFDLMNIDTAAADSRTSRVDIHAATNPIHRFKYTTILPTFKNHAKVLQFCPDEPQTFGQYLKKIRLGKHLFAKDLGLQIGCDKNTVWLWERDIEIPKLTYLRALHKIIGFPANILQDAIVRTHPQVASFKSLLFNFEIIHRRLNSALSGKEVNDPPARSFRREAAGRASFPKLFLVWRLSHLFTGREFAKMLDCDPCSITSWETGEHQPQLPAILKLRAILASSEGF